VRVLKIAPDRRGRKKSEDKKESRPKDALDIGGENPTPRPLRRKVNKKRGGGTEALEQDPKKLSSRVKDSSVAGEGRKTGAQFPHAHLREKILEKHPEKKRS